MDGKRTGHCLCGAVRFRTAGELRSVVACHCEECRRQSGHFVAATSVADDALEIDGGDRITWFKASAFARRGFCKTCGSVLFWKHEAEARTSIMAGAFDAPTGLMLAQHIYCAEKGDYYEIADGLPQFDHADDGLRVSKR